MGIFNLKKTVVTEEELQEKSNFIKNKVLMVWGSQNSGKSLLATMLAREIAKNNKDKNVALLYTEEHLPMIPCLFPEKRLENIQSLGNFYTPIKITKNYLLENITTLKDRENLALLGFLKGEHFAMYPTITDTLINQLFSNLKEEFDFIIIDGTTFFQGNQLTFQGFQITDVNLKVRENNIKDLAYFSSIDNFLNSVGQNIKNTKIVFNKCKNEVNNNADFVIDFSEDVEECFLNGDITKISDKKFLESINTIIKEVFN